MRAVTFSKPSNLSGALAELGAGNGSAPLAGGSDLIGQLKEGTSDAAHLVSLDGLEALRKIESLPGGGLRLGALVKLTTLEFAPELKGPYAMLAEAARSVATPEVRNQGTLGGNLCQRPRCLHYRHPLVSCLKKGGDNCPAADSPYQTYLSVMGGQGCYAVHPTDLGPALIALDASAEIAGPSGERSMPLESFFTGPEADPRRETVLGSGELLIGVVVPPVLTSRRGVFSKARERTAGDFAIVSLALECDITNGALQEPRVVFGGLAPAPFRSRAAEAVLAGQPASEEVANRAADAALEAAQPLAHNAYKLDLAHSLLLRGIGRLAAAGP